jgi:hypothetical protein
VPGKSPHPVAVLLVDPLDELLPLELDDALLAEEPEGLRDDSAARLPSAACCD